MHGAIARDGETASGAPPLRLVASGCEPAMNPGPDELIILIARNQDRIAFATLFQSFAPRLKSYLLRQGARPVEAEELAQEAMITIWRKAALFDPARASAATWMFRIARNLRLDAARRDRHASAYWADLSEEPAPPSTPEFLEAARQRDAHVRGEVAKLPAEQLEVLRLSFFQDQPHAQIAEALRLPLGTVKSRIRLALQRLRGSLEAES